MPKIEWLKKEFHYGYDSGNLLSLFPNKIRRNEEKRIGGSYRIVFNNAILPYIKKSSAILELGPGKGSWSSAILKHIPEKSELVTVDFQDVSQWLKPQKHNGKLKCIQINDNQYNELTDNYFDFFWSFGVLCHNNQDSISEILTNSYRKLKSGSFSIHQYGDWEKLEKYGWEKGGVPVSFQQLPDNEIWWPRNNQKDMVRIAESAGWKVISPDLNLLKRDSMILLQKQ